MPNEETEILIAKIDSLEKQISELSVKQNEIKQFVPKGVNYKLISPNSANPGHTHTGSSISALDAGDITTGLLALARGGTNKALVAANGQVAYSDADSLELTTGGSANQVLTQGTPPTWANPTVRALVNDWASAQTGSNATNVTMKSYTLPGGTMGPNGFLRITLKINGGNVSDTFDFLFGAAVAINDFSLGTGSYFFEIYIANLNTASDQDLYYVVHNLDNSTASKSNIITAATENTANDQNIVIRGTSAPTGNVITRGWNIELIKI